MADAERLSVATLAKLTASGDIAAAGRLGRSLIAEIEWRGRWTQAASDGAASSSDVGACHSQRRGRPAT